MRAFMISLLVVGLSLGLGGVSDSSFSTANGVVIEIENRTLQDLTVGVFEREKSFYGRLFHSVLLHKFAVVPKAEKQGVVVDLDIVKSWQDKRAQDSVSLGFYLGPDVTHYNLKSETRRVVISASKTYPNNRFLVEEDGQLSCRSDFWRSDYQESSYERRVLNGDCDLDDNDFKDLYLIAPIAVFVALLGGAVLFSDYVKIWVGWSLSYFGLAALDLSADISEDWWTSED